MYISREKVIEILAEHGWTPDEPTAFRIGDPLRIPIPESTFDATFGIRQDYVLEDVMKWLGY